MLILTITSRALLVRAGAQSSDGIDNDGQEVEEKRCIVGQRLVESSQRIGSSQRKEAALCWLQRPSQEYRKGQAVPRLL